MSIANLFWSHSSDLSTWFLTNWRVRVKKEWKRKTERETIVTWPWTRRTLCASEALLSFYKMRVLSLPLRSYTAGSTPFLHFLYFQCSKIWTRHPNNVGFLKTIHTFIHRRCRTHTGGKMGRESGCATCDSRQLAVYRILDYMFPKRGEQSAKALLRDRRRREHLLI